MNRETSMEGDKKSNRPLNEEPDAAAPGADRAADHQRRSPEAGWDPYEVWRTRVLLPRQQASREPQGLVNRRTDRRSHGRAARAPVAKPA